MAGLSRSARRRSEKSGFGGLSLGAAVTAALLLLPLAAAAGPVYSSSAPFPGTTLKRFNSPTVHGCGSFDQVSNRGTLNLSTGRLGFASNGTAGLCSGRATGGWQLTSTLTIISPQFVVNASGLYVLRTVWSMNLSAQATLFDDSGVGTSCGCQIAEFAITFTDSLNDLTPFGKSASGSFSYHNQVANKNGTVLAHIAKTVTMPFPVVVTSGDSYVLVIVISVVLTTNTQSNQPTNSTASASVNFDPGGHSTVYQGFSIA